jgi:antitoxin CcdA
MNTKPLSQKSKRATYLMLSTKVPAKAKELGSNLSKVCDTHLHELVQQEKEARWKSEHAHFIDAYNQTVDQEGLPLDAWRTF